MDHIYLSMLEKIISRFDIVLKKHIFYYNSVENSRVFKWKIGGVDILIWSKYHYYSFRNIITS